MMTPEIVKARVYAIAVMAVDYEAAHGEEDSLYTEVLTAIANNTCADPVNCAAECLKSQEIKFTRYCA